MAESVGSYGLLGDTRTAALVSEQGSIDWLCLPRFDADPVFGGLIDPVNGGRFSIKPLQSRVTDRAYTHHAASVRTEWEGLQGRMTTHEGMIADVSRLVPRSLLVRRITCTGGVACVEVMFDPRLGLPGARPQAIRRRRSSLICTWGATAVSLSWDRELSITPGEMCRVNLRAGESLCFVFGGAAREPMMFVPPQHAASYLEEDDRWWQRWTERLAYRGPHEENIARSLITLRLLTYAPSGAPVAAPTTSLPAPIGGNRNWDYRFSWPRDASIGASAFLAFGSAEEPRSFLNWFVNASLITRPRLNVLYNLVGRPVRHEVKLEDVAGFAHSTPVRVGNAAAQQHQLDAYGWVLEAAWLMHSNGHVLTRPQWHAMRGFADLLARRWREPDNGIWEERGQRRHYVHSKLMAWAGLDRACRLSEHYRAGRRLGEWRAERELLAQEIRSRGFSERRRSYRRVFDDEALDASVLILPALQFDSDTSMIHGTIDAIRKELSAGGPLLFRRSDDTEEGAFLPCSFWLVQALARTGRLSEAEECFDDLCGLATPLGLYAEQIDPVSRTALGNFPQAFSHATFLQAAAALNEAREPSRASSRTSRARPGR